LRSRGGRKQTRKEIPILMRKKGEDSAIGPLDAAPMKGVQRKRSLFPGRGGRGSGSVREKLFSAFLAKKREREWSQVNSTLPPVPLREGCLRTRRRVQKGTSLLGRNRKPPAAVAKKNLIGERRTPSARHQEGGFPVPINEGETITWGVRYSTSKTGKTGRFPSPARKKEDLFLIGVQRTAKLEIEVSL